MSDILQAAIIELRNELQKEIASEGFSLYEVDKPLTLKSGRAKALLAAIQALLLNASASLGECREQTPYSPLRPVLEGGRLRWCCNHDPEHCST